MEKDVECPVEVYDFRIEDDLVMMVRRLTCCRCWASCLFPLTVNAASETRHYELLHRCAWVALPWTWTVDELIRFVAGVVRHLSAVSRDARRDVRLRSQLALLLREASRLLL